jgi:hypothetical protein
MVPFFRHLYTVACVGGRREERESERGRGRGVG